MLAGLLVVLAHDPLAQHCQHLGLLHVAIGVVGGALIAWGGLCVLLDAMAPDHRAGTPPPRRRLVISAFGAVALVLLTVTITGTSSYASGSRTPTQAMEKRRRFRYAERSRLKVSDARSWAFHFVARCRHRSVRHDVPVLVSGRVGTGAALAALLLATSGCGGSSSSTSSGDVERDARVVLQADLQPGSTGRTAARLAQKFIDLQGVAGTRGDGGQHVWIYSTPDATSADVNAALSAMHAEPSVGSVERVR